MKNLLVSLLTLTVVSTVSAAEVTYPRYPSLSPDGSTLAFCWADDIWTVSAAGGVARRLTSHPAQEARSAFSPDGSTLAFESNRDGQYNLYTIDLSGDGGISRVTTSDRSQDLSGFTLDGTALLFSASQEPSMYRHSRMYTAPLDGGPVLRLTDAYGKEPRAAANGDVLFSRGYPYTNRPQYRGPGAISMWRLEPSTGVYSKLSDFDGNEYDPHQLPNGSVVFVSSRTQDNNIYRLTPGGGAIEQLTNFAPAPGKQTIGHGVRNLTVSADGTTAAFSVWDAVYTLDLTRANAAPQRVQIIASADDAVSEFQVHDLSSEAEEVALHPSGEAVAIVARGELFIRSTDKGRPARRITSSSAREGDLAWSPDGETLYFVRDDTGGLGSIFTARVQLSREDIAPEEEEDNDGADEKAEEEDEEPVDDEGEESEARDGPDHGKRWAGALAFDVQPFIDTPAWERAPRPSPDGKRLLYTRGLGDLMHVVLPTDVDGERTESMVFEGWNPPDAQWVGDSKLIVFEVADLNFNSDIFLCNPTDGGRHSEIINLTRHPDMDVSPRLSRDGKVLTFLSDRDNENWDYDVYTIYLDEALERMADYELAKHFKDSAKAAKKAKPLVPDAKPVEPYLFLHRALRSTVDGQPTTLQDAYLRVKRLTSLPGGESSLAITPGGDRVLFEAEIDDERALFSVDHTGKDRKVIAKGNVSGVSVSLTGEKAGFLKGGKANTVPITGGDIEALPIDHTIRVNVPEEQNQKFREAAGRFGASFYHPTKKGLDWSALTAQYAELSSKTKTASEFNSVFTLLLGEVEGSHTAISGGPSYDAPSPANGYLGLDSEPDLRAGGHRVTRVLPGGPSFIAHGDLAGVAYGIEIGEVIAEINGEPLVRDGKLLDLHTALAGTSGQETLFTLINGDQSRYALVTPSSFGSENNLRYEIGVLDRRAEVERLSGGRLGYLHIRSMGAASVRDFERDLFAAADGKEGLIIDVRDNGGGYTTDILLASLTAPRHAYTIPRGANAEDVPFDAYPRDRRLIYGWSRPINVLINENSFSNAEIFAHAIKTIGRGTIVGTQTFGGVISTGGFSLIDGTWVREPFRGWYLTDGTDMESNGTIPDVPVDMTPTHEAAHVHPQLDAAIAELLARLDAE